MLSPTRSLISRPEIKIYGGIFDYDNKAEKLIEVSKQLEDASVWNDPKRAQDLGREKKELEGVVLTLDSIALSLADCADLFELASAEDDEETFLAVESDVVDVEARVAQLEFRRMFNNPMDPQPAFIEIQSGAGGTEAQDWASMLERMYLRYCCLLYTSRRG